MPVGEYDKDQSPRDGRRRSDLSDCQQTGQSGYLFCIRMDDYASFIEEESNQEKFRKVILLTPDGKILGRHKGIIHYTIGQRKGLGLSLGISGICA